VRPGAGMTDAIRVGVVREEQAGQDKRETFPFSQRCRETPGRDDKQIRRDKVEAVRR
jgi:hypothetical protein